MGLREFFGRRRARRVLEGYISPEALKRIESMPRAASAPKLEHFQFVIVHIDERQATQVTEVLERVCGTLFRHGAVLLDTSPCLVVGALGVIWREKDSPESRKKTVADLIAANHTAIRIAHGQCEGLVGLFGGNTRFVYSALIPGYSSILQRLFDTQFGEAIEIP